MFADYVDKINKHSKVQKRGVVVTEQNIYKHDPKRFKLRKVAVPIAKITDIWWEFKFFQKTFVCYDTHHLTLIMWNSVSTKKDYFVVIHCDETERDLFFNLGITGPEKVDLGIQ